MQSVAALIPTYCPGDALPKLIGELQNGGFEAIVVVDDGSGPEFQAIFDTLRQISGVHLLRHAVNLGKGAALKTGINYILCQWPGISGIITADADGQHDPSDILKVRDRFLESPQCLVLGAREFEGTVPPRSRVGNAVTRSILRIVVGSRLRDSQTGLRAIPASLLPALLSIPAAGYEFELEMLVAARQLGIAMVEEPIRTIYEPDNRSSHFNPLLDSMRIYFVLLRFAIISLATAVIDNAVFFFAFSMAGHLALSQICGRAIAVLFNYAAVRKTVFHSDRRHRTVLPWYLLLVLVSGSLSYAGIVLLVSRFHFAVIPAKLLVESVLFAGNFALQRDFIFTQKHGASLRTAKTGSAGVARFPVRLWQAAVACFILVLVCYSNHFENHFQFDDSHTIVDNPYIRSLHNIPRFFTDASTFSVIPANRTWRPLVSTSLAIDYWLGGGLKPFWFHLSTFFWFLILLAAIFFLFRRILRTASNGGWVDYCALFAAAWFGLHPAMAETVNYIIQRGDLYATLGVAGSLALYALFPQRRRFGLYLIPFVLGFLAKPPAAIFPVILFAYIFLFEENTGLLDSLKRCLPALAATVVLLFLEAKLTPSSFNPGGASAGSYIATQPYIALHYFLLFFLPLWLTADTDLVAFPSLLAPDALIGLLFVIALLGTIVVTSRDKKTRPISFGLAWFVLTLLPTALFPLAEVTNDHRMFMPFVGLALAVAWTLALAIQSRVRVRPPLAAAAAVLVLVAYGQGAWQRNRVWRTEESLWKDVTIKSPHNGRGLMNYGLALMAKGQAQDALAYFEQAARFTPNYSILEINRAVANGLLGNDSEAEAHFRRAMRLTPNDALPYYFYGRWLHRKHRDPEAMNFLNISIAKNPEYLPPRYELMTLYSATGEIQDLRTLAASTLRAVPGDAIAMQFLRSQAPAPMQTTNAAENDVSLSLAYYRAGRFQDCIDAARKAVKLKPDYAEAWNNMAAGYQSLARWDEAIQAAATALRLRPDFQIAKNNLIYSVQQRALAKKDEKMASHLNENH